MKPEWDPLVARAAMPVIGEIWQDAARASPKIRTLVAHIAERIFLRGLSAGMLKRTFQVRDNNVFVQFREEVSAPPQRYIREKRHAIAMRLLVETDLYVEDIGRLLGYSLGRVFSRSFKRFTQLSPREYRERARQQD